MTDEAIGHTAAPSPRTRRGGWPKGKPRPRREPLGIEDIKAAADRAAAGPAVKPVKFKARPNWESPDFVGVGYDGVDRLRVAPEKIDAINRLGYELQWITRSVRGQDTPQELSKMTRGGWTPVHQSDFEGLLDGDFMPKGLDDTPITVEDCMLATRPLSIHRKAQAAQDREASARLRTIEDQLGHGIPNVTGSNHPTATRGNHIRRSLERVEIPE
jgi:hypothetical protein